MRPDLMGRIVWTDRKGAGHIVHGRLGDLVEKLPTLRVRATLFQDGSDEPVGGCHRAEGRDDRRIKWSWWYDRDAEWKVKTLHCEVCGRILPERSTVTHTVTGLRCPIGTLACQPKPSGL
jgi:hypothetical protein